MKKSFQKLELRAFTLTELLTVVTIIVLLMALGLSAFQRVQAVQYKAVGLHNLRNIMSAVFAYAADHDQTAPGPCDRSQYGVTAVKPGQLTCRLADYLGIPATVTAGLTVRSVAPPALVARYNPQQTVAYFAVNNIYSSKNSYIKPWGTTDQKAEYTADDVAPKKLARIPDPAFRVALIDLDQTLQSPQGGPVATKDLLPTPLYKNSRNATFWDGHAESVPLDFNLWSGYQ